MNESGAWFGKATAKLGWAAGRGRLTLLCHFGDRSARKRAAEAHTMDGAAVCEVDLRLRASPTSARAPPACTRL